MQIKDKVAVITGAGGGIGKATALALVEQGVRGLGLVDFSPEVQKLAAQINAEKGGNVARAYVGSVTDSNFRRATYDALYAEFGMVSICIPAAGITRDALSVKLDKTTGKVALYSEERFREVLEVNLTSPIYWSLELIGRIAEERQRTGAGRWKPADDVQGTIVLIGSVSSLGNKGQIAYATTKAGLEGAARTLMMEGMFYGVRCAVIHPGYTDTPMVRAMGEELIAQHILPLTQLGRLVRPEEIANAICFLISNSVVTGALWADAGWHPKG